jgi:hypothetical protein
MRFQDFFTYVTRGVNCACSLPAVLPDTATLVYSASSDIAVTVSSPKFVSNWMPYFTVLYVA